LFRTVLESQQIERDEVSEFSGLPQGKGGMVVSAGVGRKVILYGEGDNHSKRAA